jgi:DNA-binding response OmpR family regulator
MGGALDWRAFWPHATVEKNGHEMSNQRAVLIVEDDEVLRETLREHLADGHGFAVHAAATLGDADKTVSIEELRIDSIILDIMLPDGDGLDCCIRLRKCGHKIPIIILTGADGE